jgi:hypothetical protein
MSIGIRNSNKNGDHDHPKYSRKVIKLDIIADFLGIKCENQEKALRCSG